MMRHTVVSVGEVRNRTFREAASEYLKRLKPYTRMDMKSVSGEKISGDASRLRDRILEREGDRLLSAAPEGPQVLRVALDERGKLMTSVGLARFLSRRANRGKSHIAWFIGGPLGLSPALLGQSDLRLSLSRLTFPHEMVPVILLEQLYRSYKIIRREPYHY